MGLSGTGKKTYIKIQDASTSLLLLRCCCWHFSGAQRAVGVGVWLDAMDSCGWRSVQPQLLRRNESLLSPSCSGHCDQKMFPICKGKAQSLPEALVPMHMIPQVGSFTGQDGWGFGIWDLLFWGVVWSHLVSTWYDSQAPGGPPMRRCFWSWSTPETAHLDSGTCPALMLVPPTWSLMVSCCFQSLLSGYIDTSWGTSIQISSGYTEANGATTECAVSKGSGVWMLEDVGGVKKNTVIFVVPFPRSGKIFSSERRWKHLGEGDVHVGKDMRYV